jgi:hypothetical protein
VWSLHRPSALFQVHGTLQLVSLRQILRRAFPYYLVYFRNNTLSNMDCNRKVCATQVLISFTAEYQITGTEEALREYQESGIIIDASSLKRPLKVCKHPFGK